MVSCRSSSVLRSRFLRPGSLSSYVLILFVFSIVVFLFSESKIAVVDRKSISQEPRTVLEEHLWDLPSGSSFQPCVKPSHRYEAPQNLNHYLTVRSNGGLNQMRTGICDMVAVARIMNATLVIPQLDRRSFWQDSSQFSDIFDEPHFIKSLQGDVHIVRELPKELESAPRARKHFTTWSGVSYYQDIAQLWKNSQVIHVPKSDSRLANNDLPLDIQRLRCRALYHALRFSAPIENFGKELVERLRSHGRFIALHLRYEKDMLSFTGCTYGLNETEAKELRTMRQNTNHWRSKEINSTEQRLGGYCPLTPKEVGIFLRALGYPRSTWIYIAAGEIFGGETYLSDLSSRFPNLVFKVLTRRNWLLQKNWQSLLAMHHSRQLWITLYQLKVMYLFPRIQETWEKLLRGIVDF